MASENALLRKMTLEEQIKAEIVSEALEKLLKPSFRREMAIKVVAKHQLVIRVVCLAFRVSHGCYHYQRAGTSQEATTEFNATTCELGL